MFAAGLTVTLGNPKIMVFYVALLPTIVNLEKVGTVAWLELTATMFIVLMSVDLAWALFAVRARRLLRSPRAVKIANRTSATMMAGAAAAIAAR
jgi:threonine/homoserine/homoserine lactone efflux protein